MDLWALARRVVIVAGIAVGAVVTGPIVRPFDRLPLGYFGPGNLETCSPPIASAFQSEPAEPEQVPGYSPEDLEQLATCREAARTKLARFAADGALVAAATWLGFRLLRSRGDTDDDALAWADGDEPLDMPVVDLE